MIRTLFAVIGVFVLVGVHAKASCHPDGIVKVYDGTIGKSVVRVALSLSYGQVEGRYAYPVSTSDIVLKGKLDSDSKHLTLAELDAAGHPSATFDGTFSDRDPKFHYSTGSLDLSACEVLVGTWNAGPGKPPLDFRLMLANNAPSLDHF